MLEIIFVYFFCLIVKNKIILFIDGLMILMKQNSTNEKISKTNKTKVSLKYY